MTAQDVYLDLIAYKVLLKHADLNHAVKQMWLSLWMIPILSLVLIFFCLCTLFHFFAESGKCHSPFSLLHIPPVQVSLTWSRPLQNCPPLEGLGSVQDLWRCERQSVPQLDQPDQGLQPPEMAENKKKPVIKTSSLNLIRLRIDFRSNSYFIFFIAMSFSLL